jgi:hypothetical protein
VSSGVFATHLHLLVDLLGSTPGISDFKMEVVLTEGAEVAAAAARTGGCTRSLIVRKKVGVCRVTGVIKGFMGCGLCMSNLWTTAHLSCVGCRSVLHQGDPAAAMRARTVCDW